MIKKKLKKPQSLANLIVQLFVVGYSFLTLAIITQSYHFSVNSINNEVTRNLDQTSRLLQNIIDYKMAALRSSQESNANSKDLTEYLNTRNYIALDEYFFNLEQSDPINSPDFRFISDGSELIWHDGSSYFHGIDESLLEGFLTEVRSNNRWYHIHTEGLLSPVNLVIRSTPIIDSHNGKVIGNLNIAVVLNNNLSLIDAFKKSSNVDAISLIHESNIIATNLTNDSFEYKYVKQLLDSRQESSIGDHFLIHFSSFTIDNRPSVIQFLTLERNDNIKRLKQNFLRGVLLSLAAVFALVLLTRRRIKTKVLDSLNTLMNYTRSATDTSHFSAFQGTPIIEFNQIGSTLQSTLSTLIEKEQSITDLFKISLSPTIVWDNEYQIKRINPAAKAQFEYQEYSLEQSQLFSDFEKQILPHLQRASEGNVIRGIDTTINKNIFHWNLAPLVIEGQVVSIIGQAQDITTLIEAEKQSRRAQLSAEASARAKSEFLAKMSHEIRTPLNGILGIAQILRNSLTQPQQREKMDILYQSSEHLLTVLNDILDFSRIEQGKFKLEFVNLQLKEVINPVVDVYQPLCADKNISLIVNTELDITATYFSDKSRILQILFNLLSNAVKFTHEGTISLSISKSTPVASLSDEKHSLLTFCVSDTGIGIDEKYLPLLFDPFTQAEASTTRKYGGSGLGLSIVKSLIELLDGQFSIESKVGAGTSFTFSIPIREASKPLIVNTDIPKPTDSIVVKGTKVLLVEDNKTNAFVAKVFCQKYGIEVDWVENGQCALSKLAKQSYDLILMDNHMPEMGGIETTRIIREEMKITTPIYACTADAFEEAHHAFMSAGANYIIVKPIREQNFVAALEHYRSSNDPIEKGTYANK